MSTTKPVRVYISGPMSGLPDLNFPAFNAAAQQLRGLGIDAVNPAEINPDSGMAWADCMRADIKALCDCDALALLPGWEASRGAHLELHLAHRLEMKVVFLDRPESLKTLGIEEGALA
jgi:Domain of unknown function (DUF4406)